MIPNSVVVASFKNEQVLQRLTTPLNKSHIVFLVSSTKKKANVHEARHLEATFDLISSFKPEKITIIVTGKLQRHSFWNTNIYDKWVDYSAHELRRALKISEHLVEKEWAMREDEWLSENKKIIQKMTKGNDVSFISWSSVLSADWYQENLKTITDWFEEDESFRKIAQDSVDEYLSGRDQELGNESHIEVARETCIKYIIEECPLILRTTLSSNYTMYHGEPNLLMQETHRRFFGMQALPWFSTHYAFMPLSDDMGSEIKEKLWGVSAPFYSKRQEKRNSKKDLPFRNMFAAA
jgi:tRNA-dependent cyclodipeptide synthase